MTDQHGRNGLGARIAAAAAVFAIVASLLGVGVRIGSLETTVRGQSHEVTMLRNDVRSLELYVRDLHVQR